MPNKYYLREDRKAVKPTWAEPKGPTDMLSIEKMAFIEHLKSLPALDVDPDYLKTLSPGWFEGEEQYEVAGLKDKWRKCTKEEYEKRSPVLWYRVSIVAPQEAEKLNDDPVRDDFWIMNEPGQRPATPQPVTGEAEEFDTWLGKERDAFVVSILEATWNTEQRVQAENILIAFDQARERLQAASRPSDAVEFSEWMCQSGIRVYKGKRFYNASEIHQLFLQSKSPNPNK